MKETIWRIETRNTNTGKLIENRVDTKTYLDSYLKFLPTPLIFVIATPIRREWEKLPKP